MKWEAGKREEVGIKAAETLAVPASADRFHLLWSETGLPELASDDAFIPDAPTRGALVIRNEEGKKFEFICIYI